MAHLKVTIELIEHTLHRATARATVSYGKDSATSEYTIDASDGSELSNKLLDQGGLGICRLERIRSTLLERVQDKAVHRARNILIERTLTDENRVELARRGPLERMTPDLETKTKAHHELFTLVEDWKRNQK